MQATADWLDEVRRRVDARLDVVLSEAIAGAKKGAPEAAPVVEEIRALTLRGGKRVRAALAVAAVEAITSREGLEAAIDDVCASLELLQSYLLIHDDWMDDDPVRRGGPSVHVALAGRYGNGLLAGSLAILAGDFASAMAQQYAASSSIPGDRVANTIRALATMQREVVLGQVLDVVNASDLDAVHDLKTTSYTVRGPLALGHALAGGSAEQARAFDDYARPCGLAFQLRDDLIGSFGDAKQTGKPVGSDLRAGKRSAPVRVALSRLQGSARTQLESLLGQDDDGAVESALALIRVSGAIEAIEERIAALRGEALAVLERASLRDEGRRRLADLAVLLTERQR